MTSAKKLMSRLPPEAIRQTALQRLPADFLRRMRALDDLTSTLSDAMDLLGLTGVVPARVLAPNLASQTIVGQAITVRNTARQGSVTTTAQLGVNKMGELEAYQLAQSGDIIVIQGLMDASNMGGQSASLAHRAGCAGAVIDGSYRDPQSSQSLRFPIWSRGVTPITGKWRLETVEINGPVQIAGVLVQAGDLVAADSGGIVFVPFDWVERVLLEAERMHRGDVAHRADIAAGIDLTTLANTKYK
jgi:4-hydroxy-4-methyl-2-oxoglutarate aldolase